MAGLFSTYLKAGCLVLAVIVGVLIVITANDIADSHKQLAAILSLEERSSAAIDRVAETLSLGLYEGGQADRLRVSAKSQRIHIQWQRTSALSLLLAILLSITLVLSGSTNLERQLLKVAAICLGVGIFAPMLSIVAQRDVPLLGQVVLAYESKGVAATVAALYQRGHLIIALILGLFSIVIPITKLLLTAVAMGPSRLAKPARHAIHLIGKWSMTDVFVVAVLLAFLAGGASGNTDAWVGHGLWFFAAYALLSFIAAQRIERQWGR
ncbi:MAG: hypothetical protein GKR94_02710 [Gammaproteobacteria bacterium]|nr:hypothetical protein [Gammaproteobacteria bacterium]